MSLIISLSHYFIIPLTFPRFLSTKIKIITDMPDTEKVKFDM